MNENNKITRRQINIMQVEVFQIVTQCGVAVGHGSFKGR